MKAFLLDLKKLKKMVFTNFKVFWLSTFLGCENLLNIGRWLF